jgi:prepilin-type N-terminal cleavage/methylation domain-containing protein
MIKLNISEKSGQTLIEILVAIALITVVMVAVVSRTIEAVRNANFAKNQSLATRFAQEGVEWARIQRDGLRWDQFEALIEPVSPVSYCVSDLSDDLADLSTGNCQLDLPTDNIAGTIFDREVTFVFTEDLIVGRSYVTVNIAVFWTDNIGVHSSNLNTRLTEWQL